MTDKNAYRRYWYRPDWRSGALACRNKGVVIGGNGEFSIIDHGGFFTVVMIGYAGRHVTFYGSFVSDDVEWNLERAHACRDRFKANYTHQRSENSDG